MDLKLLLYCANNNNVLPKNILIAPDSNGLSILFHIQTYKIGKHFEKKIANNVGIN